MRIMQIEASQNTKQLITWIECSKAITEGCQVELKGEDGLWKVLKIYSSVDKSVINRAWKVGGIE